MVPKNLKDHSKALLKWAVNRGGRFASTSRPPPEWIARWDMSIVRGLEKKGYLAESALGIFVVTPLGKSIAEQLEMPRNESYWTEQSRMIEEDEAAKREEPNNG